MTTESIPTRLRRGEKSRKLWNEAADAIERLTEALEGARLRCPVHGQASCPEEYMLDRNGAPYGSYADVWAEDLRCGRRPTVEQVLAAPDEEGT